jgi:hypothetical protein
MEEAGLSLLAACGTLLASLAAVACLGEVAV